MSKTYLITLTPTGKFFFGGDMTFTVNGKETKFTSYIIRSNKYPQQTSLLGMLRFLILRNDKNVFDESNQEIIDRKKAAQIIGANSFDPNGNEGDFGNIKKLYPCFLQKDGKAIPFLEKDHKFKVHFDDTKGFSNHSASLDVPMVEGYDPKEGIASLYLIDGVEIPEDDIFVEDISNGINRDIETGKTDDNALFKQVCYRFNTKLYRYEKTDYDKDRKRAKDNLDNDKFTSCQYCFAFYAEMDLTEEEVKKYNGQLVSVGGDNSQFVIGLEECERVLPSEEGNGDCVVLTSPAYLTKEDLAAARFAITDVIPFKSMKTETSEVRAYNRRKKTIDTASFALYDKGSVFYFKTEDKAKQFAEKLKSHADFYQIGYNHYKVKKVNNEK